MNAVDIIKNNMDVETILDHYNIKYRYFGDYIRCACPIHGGDNPTAFVINSDFLWACHTSDCGAGDVFTLVEKLEDMPFPQAVKKVATILDIDIENMEIAERKNDYVKEIEKWLKYVKSKKSANIKHEEYKINAEMISIKNFKGFGEETLNHFGAKYIESITLNKKHEEGTFTLHERVAIPIYENGIMIGASLRKIRAKDNPKWFHIPNTIETGKLLYNIDACRNSSYIIVCEGIFDVWRWWEAGFPSTVCTFGAHLTDEQYRLILRSGKDVIWSYDNDDAGINATNKAIAMLRYKTNQWKIKLPEGKDPGDCNIDELQELFTNKERVL